MMPLTIRRRLLLLTLLPSLVLLMVILVYFFYQDSKLLHGAMLERGDTVSRYLASTAEYGVITGNLEQLQHISDSVLQGDIVALRVYDFDNRILFTSGEVTLARRDDSTASFIGQCGGNEEHLLFCAPILLASVPVSDYESDELVLQTSTIGRIELTLTTQFIAQKRAMMLRWSLLLVLTVIVLAVMLSRRMERQMVEPLSNLGRTVGKVRLGTLDVKVEESASGELLALQQGVNAMVDSLANARQHLEKEVEDATGALRNTLQELEQKNHELQLEQQRAEGASLAKSQFLATMSHEIRTPLSGMIGMLQLLHDSSENRHQLDCIDSLDSAAQSLRQLIDDILDFSRLEAGKLTIQNQSFAPLTVVEDVMVMLSPSAHHKGLEFVLDFDGVLPSTVVGDPLRFRQILINLTANAIKFTSEGEVVVLVSSVGKPQADSFLLRIEIHDSGIGISKEKQALVFESFTQIDEGDARSYGGSGLGTTVSRELVGMMGGSIGLDSELGEGSCFWFELPWQIIAEQQQAAMLDGEFLVLLLEDHEASARAVLGMLNTAGIKSERVGSEKDFWDALSARNYSWVIVGESSCESGYLPLLQTIDAQWPEINRIVQLSYVNGVRAEGKRIEHLNKPLLPTALRKLVMKAVEPGNGNDVLQTPAISVLLAEDDVINAKVILHFLEQAGHRVVWVADGSAALEELRVNDFGCVLMDMRMPGLDGLEATRRWRVEENSERVPIIALTANASDEDRRRCVEAGMNGYLTKPVDRQILLDTLAAYGS